MSQNQTPGPNLTFEQAAAQALDDQSRIAGEQHGDATGVDAVHWVAVYEELLRFKGELLETILGKRGLMSWDASAEAAVDTTLLTAQRIKYQQRLEEWTVIRDRLAPNLLVPRLDHFFGDGEPRSVGHLVLHPRRRVVVNGGRSDHLTPTEWLLLTFLLEHPERVLSREQLADGAWGPGFASRHGEVEVYISRLRRKVESRAGLPPLIQTVRGAGYRLVLPPPSAPQLGAAVGGTVPGPA